MENHDDLRGFDERRIPTPIKASKVTRALDISSIICLASILFVVGVRTGVKHERVHPNAWYPPPTATPEPTPTPAPTIGNPKPEDEFDIEDLNPDPKPLPHHTYTDSRSWRGGVRA